MPVNNSLVASVVNGSDIQLIGSTCEINVVKNNTNSSGHDVLMTLPCHYGYNYDIQQDTVITEVGDVFTPRLMILTVTESLVSFYCLFFYHNRDRFVYYNIIAVCCTKLECLVLPLLHD